ncbi:MAG: DNA internalization-related competence protein ComEC/Rec2 [Deltaproteobacteria bacterium]|nr:DNA internalization-related competence protein ComEC/Rec2 [Deltaproteobacteria bacterium]
MKAMADKMFFRPIIPLLLAMMAGIMAGIWLPDKMLWAAGVGIVCFGHICHSIWRKKAILLTPLIFYLTCGYLSVQPWVAPRFPPDHITHFLNSTPLKIDGTIQSNPSENPRRIRFVLKTESIASTHQLQPARGSIQVTVYGNHPKLTRGDRISFTSKIRPFRNFKNPGAFNYRRYMSFRKIWGAAYTSAKNLKVLSRSKPQGVMWRIQRIRDKISQLIDHSAGADTNAVLKALIIGDRSGISRKLYDVFNRTGVGHLLAISGLHIGMIASFAFFVFRALLSFVNPILWHAWTRKGAALLSLVPVCIYGVLSGMSPSTQRAVIMVGVFLFTFLLERERDAINTLAVAAMVILIINPVSLYSISFQFSFTAVFCILYGFSRLADTSRQQPWAVMPKLSAVQKQVYCFFFASIFAVLGSMPIVMKNFNQVSLVGLLGNLLAVPIIGAMVVPMGLLSVFLYPLSTAAANGVIHLAAIILSPTLGVISFLSELPFAAVKTVTPSAFEIIGYYLLGWAMMEAIRKPAANRKHAAALAVIVLLAFGADIGYWLHKRVWHRDFRTTVIDVSQGNAALLELPGGKNILIDGGGFSDNSTFDIGERVLAPFLWSKKITRIDTMILTHPNSDHLNGLLYIARHFGVNQIWTNGEAVHSIGYRRLLRIAEEKGIQMPEFPSFVKAHDYNGVRLEILYPPGNFQLLKKWDKWRSVNNNSLVVKARYGAISILFPGDIMHEAEKELVALKGARLKSTVLISPHHGSKASSSEVFLEKVSPKWVIVSSGWKNRFGFPHPLVMKRYEKLGSKVLNTAESGAVTISTDGRMVTVRPFEPKQLNQ